MINGLTATPVPGPNPQTPIRIEMSPTTAPASVETGPVEDVAAVPVAPAADVQAVKASTSFALLAKKEKALRIRADQQKAEMKAEREALGAERAEYAAFKLAKSNAKLKPLDYLRASGISYDELVQSQLSDGEPVQSLEVKQIRDELESYKREQTAARNAELEAQHKFAVAQEQDVLSQFANECAAYVTANPLECELTNLYNQSGLVQQVIENHWETQGLNGVPENRRKLLSVQDAAAAVESHLESEAERYMASKRYTSKAKVVAEPEQPPKRIIEQKPRSVSNALSASTAEARPPAKSEAERERRAIEAFIAASSS